jgi:hypothetical protein
LPERDQAFVEAAIIVRMEIEKKQADEIKRKK